jgi:glycosyltransferase involved in cell wall biosynthesis
MRVSHFSTSLVGGAGIAAKRLHLSLLERGVLSRLVYGNPSSKPAACSWHPCNRNLIDRVRNEVTHSILRKTLCNPDEVFTSPHSVRPNHITNYGILPNVVNLHWVSRWLDLPSFFGSLPYGIPVVWSLHDLNPATGGCHLPSTCKQFEENCGNCPMVRTALRQVVASRFWQIRQKAYKNLNLHIVGNSLWTTNQARKSSLFRHARSFTTIPLGLDLTEFQEISKQVAREALNIRQGTIIVGFACADVSDDNKNIKRLLHLLSILCEKHQITLVTMGDGQLPHMPEAIKTVHLSGVASPALQSIFYSCLDLFVMPSKMETFGLAALEALACGTPVVAYDTGGLPDFIIPGRTGWLVDDPTSSENLYACLDFCFNNLSDVAAMSLGTRAYVQQNHSVQSMANNYVNLYQQMLSDE